MSARLDTRWRSYSSRFLTDVHRLLALGYADARAQITGNHEEEDITGLVVQAVKARQDLGQFSRYFVTETSPVQNGERLGKRRKEIDILVECSYGCPRPHFVFEAKRLRVPGHPIGDYVGAEGLLCFIQGAYASDCKVAGMVGYVQSHKPDRWYGELSRRFESDTTGVLNTIESLSQVTIDPGLEHEWVSKHTRNDGTPVTIYHILLACHCSD